MNYRLSMRMNFFKTKTPFSFTPAGSAMYYAVLALSLGIILTRNNPTLLQHLHTIGLASVGSHASNFALSIMLLFIFGATSMLTKFSWKRMFIFAVLLMACNFITELFITILNTKDTVDAFYGVAGVIVALLLLYPMQKYGVHPTTKTS